MTTTTARASVRARPDAAMGTRTLVTFLALTFGLSWGPMAFLTFFGDAIGGPLGEVSTSNPFYYLAIYAPSLVGLALVVGHYGLAGLGRFLRRLALWRAPGAWWAFLVLGVPAIIYGAAAIVGTISDPFAISPWYMILPALVRSLLLGPLGEEFGWRGLALPLLQRRFAPFWASLILGTIWAVWHAPAFLMSGTVQSAWAFGPFLLGLIAIAVILTPFFNASGGSLLIAILYHLQIMNPAFPDAQPWDSYLLAIAAVGVVVLNRRTMFRRGAGSTAVLLDEAPAALAVQGAAA